MGLQPDIPRCRFFLLLLSTVSDAGAQIPPPQTTPVAPLTPEEAAPEILEARVRAASDSAPCTPGPEDELAIPGAPPPVCQRVELLITAGTISGQRIVVEEGRIPLASKTSGRYARGDRVYVDWNTGVDNLDAFYITDFIRTDGLQILLIAFLALCVILGGWRGRTLYGWRQQCEQRRMSPAGNAAT